MARAEMRIGELARRAACSVEAIRYYERTGLLPAAERTTGNYRSYGERHLERLAFIRRCRSLDMAQDEIRVLLAVRDLPQGDCRDANRLLEEHMLHVGRRIAELESLRKELAKLHALCSRSRRAKDCGILRELSAGDAPRTRTARNSLRHVHGTHPAADKR